VRIGSMPRSRKPAEQRRGRSRRTATKAAIAFIVKYPWGLNYCERLRAALARLGLSVGADPFIEGSDNGGFLVALNRDRLAKGRRIIREQSESEDLDVTLGRLWQAGVYEIMQDWKWLEWKVDVPTLNRLGVKLTRVEEGRSREGTAVITFNVSRVRRSRG